MSKKAQPKTTGYTWLEYSLTAFNGTGYGDYQSPESFLDSYVDYKRWKKDYQAVALAGGFYVVVLAFVTELLKTTPGPSVLPSAKNYAKFLDYRG